MIVSKECLNCSKVFKTPASEIKRGNGKFCCRLCCGKYNGILRIKIPNTECFICKKAFYRNPNAIKRRSKSGLVFCSRVCKEFAQSIQGGVSEIQPKHYKTGEANYREIAYKFLERKCNRCQYSKHVQILEVHHKDRNRKNNQISNLEVLCPNCHMEEHFLQNDGKWNPTK
jgi:5-methylcytosine-specific restriction endonuclease McrA